MNLLEKNKAEGFMKILGLDGRGIHDSNIWVLYKDYCGEDINKMWDLL
jgi:hypothetical protein